jgi:hypothetical protein
LDFLVKQEGVKMGAWSHTPFGNDDACDWVYELEKSTDLQYIEKSIDDVLKLKHDYIDCDMGARAIAAVEVVLLLCNYRKNECDNDAVLNWVRNMGVKPNKKLISNAQKCVNLLTSDDSELADLWRDNEEWFNDIDKVTLFLSKALQNNSGSESYGAPRN